MFKKNYKNSADRITPSEETKNRILTDIENGTVKTPKSLKMPMGRIASCALAVCIAVSAMTVVLKNGGIEITKDKQETVTDTAVKTAESIKPTESYSEIFEKLKVYYENEEQSYNKTYVKKNTIALEKTETYTDDASTSDANNVAYYETNAQKDSITEGDIVKTDGKYIYICRPDGKIDVYSADGKNSALISTVTVAKKDKNSFFELKELYVYKNKLVAIAAAEDYSGDNVENTETRIFIYDTSDKQNIKLQKKITQDGWFTSSRVSNGILYAVSSYNVYVDGLTEDDISAYIPKYTCGTEGCYFDADDIFLPDNISAGRYTVVASYSVEDAKVIDTKSVLGGTNDVYLDDARLVIGGYSPAEYEKNKTAKDSTQLILFNVDNGKMTLFAVQKIDGALLNQFSLDFFNGHLRAVTTVSEYKNTRGNTNDDNAGYVIFEAAPEKTYNILYILDDKLNITGKTENLAEDERVYSVRFMGDTAYFVTYRETDPLFAVDLKDPTAPKILSALKIDGFSTYLHPLEDGKLLGYGYNSTKDNDLESLKLSMFDIKDPANVREITRKTVSGSNSDLLQSEATDNHKAFFADTKRNLFGFEYSEEDYNESDGNYAGHQYYVIYTYSNGEFKEVKKIDLEITDYYTANARGLYCGNTFYVGYTYYNDSDGCYKTRLAVYDYNTFEHIKTIK